MQKQTFRQVSEIFENLRKCLEIFGKNRKMSQSAQDDLPAFLFFFKIFGNCRKSSEKNRKMSESSQNDIPALFETFENFRKSSEVFGNARKTSETLGSL